jgi:hypothetical protein
MWELQRLKIIWVSTVCCRDSFALSFTLFTGCEADFMLNAFLIFESGMKTRVYHEEMNARHFTKSM